MSPPLDDLRVDDDGLVCGTVHRWAEEKYRLLSLYDDLFSTGMKNKWDQRVYIDLYAGSGFSRIQGTRTILKGSPIIALTVPTPFDRYIFCEDDEKLMNALELRTKRIAQQSKVTLITGSCDVKIDEICGGIPKASGENRILSLCFVDPFDFGIKFSTIRRLSRFFVDFLVLLAIGMDANRNYEHYVEGNSPKIDEALGNTDWRERWQAAGVQRRDFMPFLAVEFSKSMESLGYLPTPLHRMKLVRSDDRNLPLYYLALFSRHDRGHAFWDAVLKYGTDQTSFDW